MIRFTDVNFSYSSGRHPVLKGLSLHIKKGRITALLGPNGTGKTTMINLALGWLKPDAGRIEVDGKELIEYSGRKLSRRISLVPQQEVIPFHLSVLDFVLFGRTPYLRPLEMPGPEDLEIAKGSLLRLGIGELADRPVTALSGGEKHLVLLARSLTQQTECILMDEPTNHMDPANRISILRTIKTLADSGSTIFFSTHHPEIALELADETVGIKDGAVIISGETKGVITGENLFTLYGAEAEIFSSGGKKIISWLM
ncbi:MAG: ABC transporter ATP-binding protein [Spirochaetales bacterium]|nr:ABC transporter ATP-binding protein [Spirochaetales bacterium]